MTQEKLKLSVICAFLHFYITFGGGITRKVSVKETRNASPALLLLFSPLKCFRSHFYLHIYTYTHPIVPIVSSNQSYITSGPCACVSSEAFIVQQEERVWGETEVDGVRHYLRPSHLLEAIAHFLSSFRRPQHRSFHLSSPITCCIFSPRSHFSFQFSPSLKQGVANRDLCNPTDCTNSMVSHWRFRKREAGSVSVRYWNVSQFSSIIMSAAVYGVTTSWTRRKEKEWKERIEHIAWLWKWEKQLKAEGLKDLNRVKREKCEIRDHINSSWCYVLSRVVEAEAWSRFCRASPDQNLTLYPLYMLYSCIVVYLVSLLCMILLFISLVFCRTWKSTLWNPWCMHEQTASGSSS